jgi:serine/threonine-protein kinase
MEPGSLLHERYRIEGMLGKGGMGAVYVAYDQTLQLRVAVKENLSVSPDSERQFHREASLLASLRHPNLPRVTDHFILEGRQYLVMDFIEGEDLHSRSQRQPSTVDEVLRWADALCDALTYLHTRQPPIIHRDIKPANVRLLEDGSVKIMDFGIARSLETESRLTQTGVALGTAGYLAPEQLSGKPLDQRTDLFSLGVLAYEMVTGQRPFAGPNLSNVIYQILNQEPVPAGERNPACPDALSHAIMKALAKDPDDRYRTVREFGQALKEVLGALPRTGESRRQETTTAILRDELGKLTRTPRSELTAPTQLSALPLDRLPTTQAAEPAPRRRRWIVGVALAAVAAVAAVAIVWTLRQGSTSARAVAPASQLALPTPQAGPQATPALSPTVVPAGIPATVTLFVDPPSEVEVDGRALGKVQSAEIALEPGPHLFRQRIAGYREQTLPITIEAGTREVKLQLPPFGLLSVFNDFGVSVRETVVLLDGKPLGPLPLQERKVQAGEHLLEVRWPDGGLLRQSVAVPAQGHQRVTVSPQG